MELVFEKWLPQRCLHFLLTRGGILPSVESDELYDLVDVVDPVDYAFGDTRAVGSFGARKCSVRTFSRACCAFLVGGFFSASIRGFSRLFLTSLFTCLISRKWIREFRRLRLEVFSLTPNIVPFYVDPLSGAFGEILAGDDFGVDPVIAIEFDEDEGAEVSRSFHPN